MAVRAAINFRGTLAGPISMEPDEAHETPFLSADSPSYPSDAGPNVRGEDFGFTTSSGTFANSAQTNAEARISGYHSSGYGLDGVDVQLRLDVATPGRYEIRLALGGAAENGNDGAIVDLWDGAFSTGTLLATILDGTQPSTNSSFYDATGVNRAALSWVDDNQPIFVDVSAGYLTIRMRNGSSGGARPGVIAHVEYTLLGGEEAAEPDPLPFFVPPEDDAGRWFVVPGEGAAEGGEAPPPVVDDFERPNEQPLGAPYIQSTGNVSQIDLISGAIISAHDNLRNSVEWPLGLGADQYCEASRATNYFRYQGPLVRYNAATGDGYCALYRSSRVVELNRIVGGVPQAALDTSASNIPSDATRIRLEAVGDQLSVYVDDVLVIGPFTDATYPTGQPGLYSTVASAADGCTQLAAGGLGGASAPASAPILFYVPPPTGEVPPVVLPASGTVAGSSVLTGTAILAKFASGTFAGTSTLTGDAQLQRILPASGTFAGAGTLTGSVRANLPVSATVAGSSTLTGNSDLILSASGTVAGSSTLQGDAERHIPGSGTLAGTSTLTGDARMSGVLPASGTFSGTSTLVGNTRGEKRLSGTVAGSSTLTGNARIIGEDLPTSGTVAGTSSLAGDAVIRRVLQTSGTIAGTSSLTATTMLVKVASGQVDGTSALTGAPRQIHYIGQVTIAGTSTLLGSGVIPSQTIGRIDKPGIGVESATRGVTGGVRRGVTGTTHTE